MVQKCQLPLQYHSFRGVSLQCLWEYAGCECLLKKLRAIGKQVSGSGHWQASHTKQSAKQANCNGMCGSYVQAVPMQVSSNAWELRGEVASAYVLEQLTLARRQAGLEAEPPEDDPDTWVETPYAMLMPCDISGPHDPRCTGIWQRPWADEMLVSCCPASPCGHTAMVINLVLHVCIPVSCQCQSNSDILVTA